MKTIFSFIGVMLWAASFAGLSPAETNEFCPNTSISFTYTVSGNYSSSYFSNNTYTSGSISATSYSSITGITTITFTLNFNDISLDHSIRLNYTDGITTTYRDILFQKIKSLYSYTGVPTLNISTINVDSCATNTTNVSFANLKWKNFTTNPATEFGTITDYEYSVPAGWKVNGSLSTGVTDLKLGNNAATIESDNITPGQVLVRPANKCASGLSSGGNWAVINIIRNKPQLTFQSVSTICTSAVFQANSLPSWVTTFQWSTNPATGFNFSNGNTNPTTVYNNGSVVGKIGLLISGSGCPATFFYNNTEITGAAQLVGGTPLVTTGLQLYTGTGSENGVCFNVDTYIPCVTEGYTSYPNWSYVSNVGSPQPSWNGTDQDIAILFFRSQQTSLVLQLDASNTCGTSTYQFGFAPINCAGLRTISYKYNISPNPTNGIIHITKKTSAIKSAPAQTSEDLRIIKVEVYDFNNTLRLTQRYDYLSNVSLNLGNFPPGNYILVITNPQGKETQQVILR